MTSKAQVPTGIDPDSMGRSMWRRNPVPGYGAALVLIVVIIASFASYLYEQRIDALEQARLEQ